MVSARLRQEFNYLHYFLTKSASVTIHTSSKAMYNLKKKQAFKASAERHSNQRQGPQSTRPLELELELQ